MSGGEISTEFLVAESAIRQLHARYIDATWRQDIDTFKGCFAEDAQWEIAGLHVRGREEIGATLEKLLTGSSRVLMTISMLLFEIDGDHASGTTRVTESIKRENGDSMRTIGSYADRYICDAGVWRFQSRQWQLNYRGPMDLSAPLAD